MKLLSLERQNRVEGEYRSMNKYLEIGIIVAFLGIVLASLKIVLG